MLYETIFGKPVPKDCLILPLQSFQPDFPNIILFVKVNCSLQETDLKKIEEVQVIDIIRQQDGQSGESLITLDQVLSLHTPSENFALFTNEIFLALKLQDTQLPKKFVKSTVARLCGHSLYLKANNGFSEYSSLSYISSNLQQSYPDENIFLDILRNCLPRGIPSELINNLKSEILNHSQLIESPFTIYNQTSPFKEALPSLSPEEILKTVYNLIQCVCAYATKGIYFSNFTPDKLHLDSSQNLTLIDCTYIDKNMLPENRYILFTKQSSLEYLPGEYSRLTQLYGEKVVNRYFGQFTCGVLIGIIERVLLGIFLPKQMMKFKEVSFLPSFSERIQRLREIQARQDIQLFGDKVTLYEENHFEKYRHNLKSLLLEEGWDNSLAKTLSKTMAILRHFSCPVFFLDRCVSLLVDDSQREVPIQNLTSYVATVFPSISDLFLEKKTITIDRSKESLNTAKNLPEENTAKNLPEEKEVVLSESRELPPLENSQIEEDKTKATSIETAVKVNPPRDKIKTQRITKSWHSFSSRRSYSNEARSLKSSFSEESSTETKKRTLEELKAKLPLESKQESSPEHKIEPKIPLQEELKVDLKAEDETETKKEEEKKSNIEYCYTDKSSQNDYTHSQRITKYWRNLPQLVEEAPGTTEAPEESPKLEDQEEQTLDKATKKRYIGNLRDQENPHSFSNKETRRIVWDPKKVQLKNEEFEVAPLESKESEDTQKKHGIITARPPYSRNREEQPSSHFMDDSFDSLDASLSNLDFDMEKLSEETKEIIEFIERKLANIHLFLKTNPTFHQIFIGKISLEVDFCRQFCKENDISFREGIDSLISFIENTEITMVDPETELQLLRMAQKTVPSDIAKKMEKIAPDEIKQYFRAGPKVEQRCRNLVKKNLVRIAKIKFLNGFDPDVDILSCMPQDEDILTYIYHNDRENGFCSLEEVIRRYASEIRL